MFQEHPLFIPPNNKDQLIWRYLDFTKFVDLLNTKSLYFTRADIFEDLFEGSLTKPSVEARTAIDNQFENIANKLSVSLSAQYKKAGLGFRDKICINCWHLNEYESAAMWKLYLKSNEGIAIQSTYNKFISSFNDTLETVHVGVVKYIDYERDFIDFRNSFNPYLHKRKSFAHEHEIRAILWREEDNNRKVDLKDGGWKVKVDLQNLIQNIYVSPDSQIWFNKLVQDITLKFGLKINVVNSSLTDKPMF